MAQTLPLSRINSTNVRFMFETLARRIGLRPSALLAHGWGGRATQMRRFVPALVAAGYRVVAYDQPAHGLSEGRLTGLPDFADALAEVARHHGGVRAVIAHSLGGPAAAIALARGLALARVVL